MPARDHFACRFTPVGVWELHATRGPWMEPWVEVYSTSRLLSENAIAFAPYKWDDER